MITPEQIRAARAMLGLSQLQLAEKAGIALATLNNIERGVQTDPKMSTINAIRQTLEERGIEFTRNSQDCLGISLTRKKPEISLIASGANDSGVGVKAEAF